jgi:N-methylhydantoinase A/oxoprolinase/acetone carboxylase beta subunit
MAVHTIGLGGDSEIDLSAWPAVTIGPRRIIPISRMHEPYPDARQRMQRLEGQILATDRNALEWVALAPGIQPNGTFENLLSGGPVCLQELARNLLRPTPAHLGWSDLESRGRVQRFGLTLTDILHHTGEFTAYDREAAAFLVNLWAALIEVDAKEIVEAVQGEFRRLVCEQTLRVVLPGDCPWEQGQPLTHWLTQHLVDSVSQTATAMFQVRIGVPLIAVGAPVSALFPQLSSVLHQDILISGHAGVANAIGAIAGDVRLQESAEIRVADDGGLLCRWRGGYQRATSLENALLACEQAIKKLIAEKAQANDIPYAEPDIRARIQQAETRDGVLLLGLALLATLRG